MELMEKRIFVTHKLPGKYLDELKPAYDVEVWPGRDISRKSLLLKVKGVLGIVCLLTERIDKQVMDAAGNNLKVISNYAVGFDNIDIAEASKRGIVVTNTPGVLTEAVAEHVIALMLALARRLVEGDKFVRSGKYHGWEPDLLIGTGIRSKSIGVVGLGRIGQWVARLASGLGMEVMYYSRSKNEEFELECGVTYMDLAKLLSSCDVVSINVPLTDETFHLIGENEFAKMKKTAILINTARGAVVDEKAMIEALKHKNIAGAGLDVFENEREVNLKLRQLDNVILTPHTASATIEARLLMAKLAVKGMAEALAGRKPANIVNEEVLRS